MVRATAVSLALFVLACGVYWQTRHFDFVNYDDKGYVTAQPELRHGFSGEGLRWALTLTYGGYMPLTGLSLYADAGLHGMDAGGYHLTNAVLHALAATLLFLFLWRATGAIWASALVAALFAVHPLRVESVAWISSRKDLVCGVFWMFTLHAYAVYNARPGFVRYLLVFFGMCAALLAKPMAVTLPCVLFLMDLWPLHRHGDDPLRRTWRVLALEKIPLFIPVFVTGVATFIIQRDTGGVSTAEALPIGLRLANAIVAYALYLWKTIWPVGLVPLYPFPIDGIPLWHIALSVLVLLAISVAVVRVTRTAPWALVGWLWFLGTLVPVIGLVQVGAQRMADRYTYLPQIGLFIIIAWSLRRLVQRAPRMFPAAVLTCAAILVACVALTHRQSAHWRDSLALWSHTVAITPDSIVARSALGEAYLDREQWTEARRELEAALHLNPHHTPALLNLARVDVHEGRLDDAILRCQAVVAQYADDPDAHTTWAAVLIRQKEYGEALEHLDIAQRVEPNHPEALSNRGAALVLLNRPAEAILPLEQAMVVLPDDAVVLTNLGAAHYLLHDVSKARHYCNEALQADPAYERALALKKMLDAPAP